MGFSLLFSFKIFAPCHVTPNDIILVPTFGNIKKYDTPEQRTAAREAFQDLKFSVSLPAVAASQIIYGDQEKGMPPTGPPT